MGRLRADKPLDLVCIDFLTVDKSTDGREHILVITDCYTKFSKAIPTRDQLAKTVAKILMNEWFFNFGIPNRIHSDMGRNFVSAVVREICSSFGSKRSTTNPYHPMGNGQVERFNRTLLGLIRTLSREERGKWSIHLNKLIHSYNTMPHTSTGYSPFYLMLIEKIGYQLRKL